MNIIDIGILVIIGICLIAGLFRGFLKETVLLAGLFLILIVAFKFRVPISTFMYKNLPFISNTGLFAKFSSLNILLYELLAFLITVGVLYIILRVLLMISGIIEKIFKLTVVLGFFSKIGGAILGALEGYILVFIILFIINMPFLNIAKDEINESKYNDIILEKTPILSNATDNLLKVTNEINSIITSYKEDETKDFNEKTIEILLKYNIVSEENIEYLKEKGKIK